MLLLAMIVSSSSKNTKLGKYSFYMHGNAYLQVSIYNIARLPTKNTCYKQIFLVLKTLTILQLQF